MKLFLIVFTKTNIRVHELLVFEINNNEFCFEQLVLAIRPLKSFIDSWSGKVGLRRVFRIKGDSTNIILNSYSILCLPTSAGLASGRQVRSLNLAFFTTGIR